MDVATPCSRARLESPDLSPEPGLDLDRLETTNSAKLNQSLAEAARPGSIEAELLMARAEARRHVLVQDVLSARSGSANANAGPSSRPCSARSDGGSLRSKIPVPNTVDFVYNQNATPAKWNLDAEDVPSPFLRPGTKRTPQYSPAPLVPKLDQLRKYAVQNRRSGGGGTAGQVRVEVARTQSTNQVERLL